MSDANDPQFSPLRMMPEPHARPLRAVLSILAISIQSFCSDDVGLTTGVVNEWSKRVEGVGADILVQSPNAFYFLCVLQRRMQGIFGDQIAALRRGQVAPTLSLMDKKLYRIYGID